MDSVLIRVLLLLLLINFPAISQERTVNMGGRKFNIFTAGIEKRSAGDPVVIFESGMGVDLQNWNKIMGRVSEFAPVFAYDRAGIGRSDKTYTLPTPKNVAENLNLSKRFL